MVAKLPKWLKREKDGTLVIDPDIAYPLILEALGVGKEKVDQFWLEVAYQAAKQAALDAVAPERPKLIVIASDKGRKTRWSMRKFQRGAGAEAARATPNMATPSAARRHYWRIAKDLLSA